MHRIRKHGYSVALIVMAFITLIFLRQNTRSVYYSNAQAGPFMFVAWGDTKSARGVLSSLSTQAKLLNPSFSIYSGDLEDSGFTQSGAALWRDAMNGGSSNGMADKVFPVRGNHDAGNTTGWQQYYHTQTTAVSIGATNYQALAESLTYSFDFQNAHIVGIDVTGDASKISAEQVDWLNTDLKGAEQRGITHAFIFFHGPIYCVAEHCSCTTRTCSLSSTVNALVTVFNNHPIVSATFHGHEHTYDYVHLDSTRIAGLTHPVEEFVVGDAGAGPAGCAKTVRFDYCMSTHGFATVTVDGPSYTVNFFTQGNTTPHKSFSFTKDGVVGISPTAGSCPKHGNGDANCDSVIDIADFEIFRKEYLHEITTTNSDFNGDSQISINDFETWRKGYFSSGI